MNVATTFPNAKPAVAFGQQFQLTWEIAVFNPQFSADCTGQVYDVAFINKIRVPEPPYFH